ncbi:MAG: ThiF family adenylyltransferase [Kiritimatiellae bacterium]|nr:ThiF family adenylyltransferase [Kiritimatiellia bacterium]
MPPAGPAEAEGRFARFRAIEWWDQARLRRARVLVIGAGALGNEVIKNLALLGVGQLVIVDMDRIELSNLSRSVLFRESDAGGAKSECAARAAQSLYPAMRVSAIVGNVLADVGLGHFRWADVVVGALDNREARVFVNSACARVGRPWIDGGIDVLTGIVRGFAPPRTACYECTMSRVDWDLLNKRRSCSLLARRATQEGGVPTTPTTAAVVGGIQAQEVVKVLHGMDALLGRGYMFEGGSHNSYLTEYAVMPDCAWHDTPCPVEALPGVGGDTRLADLWETAAGRLGGLDAVDFGRELVETLTCSACGRSVDVFRPVDHVTEDQARCGACGAECVPAFFHSVGADSPLRDRTLAELGLPRWDIVWARKGEERIGLEMAGDCPVEPAEA